MVSIPPCMLMPSWPPGRRCAAKSSLRWWREMVHSRRQRAVPMPMGWRLWGSVVDLWRARKYVEQNEVAMVGEMWPLRRSCRVSAKVWK
jgi:hypothetical protein